MQDSDDGLLKCSNEKIAPRMKNDFWMRGGSNPYNPGVKYSFSKELLSDDADISLITREELMRAYDLTEQGYTLWFGGECPIDGWGANVDYICENGFVGKGIDAQMIAWFSKEIIAYRISEVNNEPEEKFDSDSFGKSDRYNRGSIECIDIIKEMTSDKSGLEAFCVGNVVKYLYRYKDKNGMADVIKARNYLNKIIEGDKK